MRSRWIPDIWVFVVLLSLVGLGSSNENLVVDSRLTTERIARLLIGIEAHLLVLVVLERQHLEVVDHPVEAWFFVLLLIV